MKTISVIVQKGGTGKTTVLLNLAGEFIRNGYVTAIMDVDPQPSAIAWGDIREAAGLDKHNPPILDTKASRLAHAKDVAAEQGLDVLLIDTSGRTDEGAFIAAQVSDLVLVPLQPSKVDMVSMPATQQLLARAGNPKAVALLNRVIHSGERHTEAAEGLQADGWEILPETIGQRVAFQDAYAAGKTMAEYGGPGHPGTLEMQQVYKAVCQQVGLPTVKQKPSRAPRPAVAATPAATSAKADERTQHPFGRLRDRR